MSRVDHNPNSGSRAFPTPDTSSLLEIFINLKVDQSCHITHSLSFSLLLYSIDRSINQSIAAASLPETSPPIPRIRTLAAQSIMSMPPRRETGKEDDEGREKQTRHRRNHQPYPHPKLRAAPAIILGVVVNVVADGARPDEIRGQHDDRQGPGESGDEGGEQGAADAAAEGEQEGDEG